MSELKNIITIGGQGFLKECVSYLLEDKNVNLKGYLSIDGFKPELNSFEINFLGDLADYKIQNDDYFVICAGDIKRRKEYYERLKSLGAKFHNLIYNSRIHKSTKIGEANIIITSDITVDIEIGNCNIFNGHITVGHDSQIKDNNFFGPSVQILGNVKIGSNNSLGTLSCILPHGKIGNNNIIAPGSFIYKFCKNNCYYMGNPAKKIGNVEE